MKKYRLFIACFLCTSATFGASLGVWNGTLDSKTFSTNGTTAVTTEFTESGLSVSTLGGTDFLVLSSFTTGNNGIGDDLNLRDVGKLLPIRLVTTRILRHPTA